MGSTLGEMKALGEGIILYCQNNVGVRWCGHSHRPSIDQLIQYFGVDFDVVANRAALLGRFVCEKCGGRVATLQLEAPLWRVGFNGGVGDSVHGFDPGISVEEATRRYHEMTAERKRMGLKTNEEINVEARAQLKAQKRAAKAGADFIGPPSPWAHRKKGRWL